MPVSCRCIFCDSNSYKKFEIKKFSRPFEIWECPSCGLLFQNPLPCSSELEAYYQEGYYTGKNEFAYQDERKNFKYSSYVWKARIKRLQKNLRTKLKDKKILDIGCSFGGLLQNAKEMGLHPYGIEISDFSRKYVQKQFQIPVYKTLKEAKFQDNFFDAVTMIELIEHLDQPCDVLSECFRILKKGGLLLIQTANMQGQQAIKAKENYHYFLPGHLYYFSRKNLRQKLLEIGFTHVRFFHPVEFGLLPKLRKSRGNFHSIKDFLNWIKIISYHLKSFVHFGEYCLTSSMVVYAWK